MPTTLIVLAVVAFAGVFMAFSQAYRADSLSAQGVQLLSNLATFLGIVFVAVVYFQDRKKAKIEREVGTVRTMHELYADYLKICIERPELGLYDGTRPSPEPLTPAQNLQKLAAMELWVSMCEAAFFEYTEGGHESDFKRRQWTGWMEYIEWQLDSRDDLLTAWNEGLGTQYDQGFTKVVDAIVVKVENEKRAETPGTSSPG